MKKLSLSLVALLAVSCGPDALQVENPPPGETGGGGGTGPGYQAACDADPAGAECASCRSRAEDTCGRTLCAGIAESVQVCAEHRGCVLDESSYDEACLMQFCRTELSTMNRCVLSCSAWGNCGGFPDGICTSEPDGIGCATCQIRSAERCDGITCAQEHGAWNNCALQCADEHGVVDQVCENEFCPAERDAMYGCEAECTALSKCGADTGGGGGGGAGGSGGAGAGGSGGTGAGGTGGRGGD